MLDTDRLQRLVMWIVAIVVVGGTVLALRYVRGYRPLGGLNFSAPTDLPANIVLRFDNVRIVGRKDHKTAWSLVAGKVQTDRNRTTLNFSRNVTATLMNDGKPRAVLTAPQATYDANARLLVAAGRIECRVLPKAAVNSRIKPSVKPSSDDLVVEAQEVIWNVGTQTIVCQGPVSGSLPGMNLQGNDLSVNLMTREMSIHQFHATLTLDDSGENGFSNTLQGLMP